MKTIYHILVFSFLFVSCSSDDANGDTVGTEEPINVQEQKLIATWNLTNFEFIQERGVVKSGILETPLTFTSKGSDYNFTYKFSDNPKKSESEGSFTIKSSATVGSQETPIEDEVISTNGEVVEGAWELLEGNKIQIIESGETKVFEIITLSDSTLQMRTESLNEDDVDLDDTMAADIDLELEGYYVFTFMK